MAEQTIEDLGKLVKAKYPQYAALPDAEVGRKVKAKYPQYSQFKETLLGAEKTGLPGGAGAMPMPPMREYHVLTGAAPLESEQNFITSPHGFFRSGARDIATGMESAASGRKAEGAAQALKGAGEIAAPPAIGATMAGLATHPLSVLARGATGVAGSVMAKKGAKRLGAGEDMQEVAAVVGGLLGAGFGPKEQTMRDIIRFRNNPEVREAVRDIWTGWKNKVPFSKDRAQALDRLKVALTEAKGTAARAKEIASRPPRPEPAWKTATTPAPVQETAPKPGPTFEQGKRPYPQPKTARPAPRWQAAAEKSAEKTETAVEKNPAKAEENPYKAAAQVKKAARIADKLRERKIPHTLAKAANKDKKVRELIAEQLGEGKEPGEEEGISDTTWAHVMSNLRRGATTAPMPPSRFGK